MIQMPAGAMQWDRLGALDILPQGHPLGTAELLFEKIEDSVVEAQLQKLADTKAANLEASVQVAEQKSEIAFDDFSKLDIRVSRVTAAEKVPKTQKLLKLTVDTGIDTRTIVSGIAEYFTPEEMVGKQVLVLVNLAPRTMRGIESQGMILMAETPAGKLALVAPAAEDEVAAGSVVG